LKYSFIVQLQPSKEDSLLWRNYVAFICIVVGQDFFVFWEIGDGLNHIFVYPYEIEYLDHLIEELNPSIVRQICKPKVILLHLNKLVIVLRVFQIALVILKGKQIVGSYRVQEGSTFLQKFQKLLILFNDVHDLLNFFNSVFSLVLKGQRLAGQEHHYVKQLRPIRFDQVMWELA